MRERLKTKKRTNPWEIAVLSGRACKGNCEGATHEVGKNQESMVKAKPREKG